MLELLRTFFANIQEKRTWSKKCKKHCQACACYQFCKKPSCVITECYGLMHPDTIAYLENMLDELRQKDIIESPKSPLRLVGNNKM